MDNEIILEDVRDVRIKLESAINLLKDGKTIVTYERLLGIKDKLNRLMIKLDDNKKYSK